MAIIYGDWSNSKRIKYLIPSSNLIEKKYKVLIIDEYYTLNPIPVN